jgi:hypothetical protein
MTFHEPTYGAGSVSIDSLKEKKRYTYLWLGIFKDVEATHEDTRSTKQMAQFDVDVPVDPSPVLVAVSHWSFRELSNTVQPVFTIVKTDLNSLYLVTTSIVGIPSDAISVALLHIC